MLDAGPVGEADSGEGAVREEGGFVGVFLDSGFLVSWLVRWAGLVGRLVGR